MLFSFFYFQFSQLSDALILFIQTLAFYKSFTYLLTYLISLFEVFLGAQTTAELLACVRACVSVNHFLLARYLQKLQRILMKFYAEEGCGPGGIDYIC